MVDPHARSNQVLMALEATGVDVHEEARKDDHGGAKKEIDTKVTAIKAKAEATLKACKECKAAEDAVVAGYKKIEDAHTAAEAAAKNALAKEGAYNDAKTKWSLSIDAFIAAFEPIKTDAATLDTDLQKMFDGVVGSLKAVLGSKNHDEKETTAAALAKLDAMVTDSKTVGNAIDADLKPKLKIVKTMEADVRAKKLAYNGAMHAYNTKLAAVKEASTGLKSTISTRNEKCKGADLKFKAFEGKGYKGVTPPPASPPPGAPPPGSPPPPSNPPPGAPPPSSPPPAKSLMKPGSVVPASAITVSGYMAKGAEGSYHQGQGTQYKGGIVFKSPIDLYSFDAVGLYAKTYSQNGACNAITLAAYSTSGAQIWSSGSLDLSKTQWTSWKNVKVGKAGVKQLKIIAKNTSGKPGWCWPSFKNFKVGSGGSGGGPIKDVKGSSLKSGSCFGQCPTNSYSGQVGSTKSCVGKNYNHAGNKYTFKVPSAGTYKVAVKWGDSTWADKTYLRWDAEPTKGSNLKSVEGSKKKGCSASACGYGKGNGDKNSKMTYSASLSAGTHTLYIGSIKDGNYYTVPWCDITLIGA